MRALAEKDRHIEGCWTGYSPSLERSILKKAKYLEDAPAREAPLEPAPVPVPVPAPAAPAVVERPQPSPAPSGSPFAEKLQQAWRKDP
jgi:hypothetical protein